jgi:hypothetical protein
VIFYAVTRPHRNSINRYLDSWGRPLRVRITPYPYEDLRRSRRVPPGSWIFSDVERLELDTAEWAAALHDALATAGMRVLNHPTRSMRRYELLRTLRERGINDYDVYRVAEARRPARFPVFLRGENDHRGSLTGLLDGPDQLARALDEQDCAGRARERLLVCEFRDTVGTDGLYRKFSAFRVGDRIVPRHLFFSRDWMLKRPDVVEAAQVDEELRYVRDNPHEQELRAIFTLARVEYGRVDYSLREGGLCVWEINTNPWIMSFEDAGGPRRLPIHEQFAAGIRAAFEALDADAETRGPVPVPNGGVGIAAGLAAEAYHAAVRRLGLLRHESRIMETAKRMTGRARPRPPKPSASG